MKILVTGGAGFIGSHIVDKLVQEENEVIIIDNLSTGKKINLNPTAIFYQISITDPKIEEIFQKHHPEFVIHQAAQVDINKAIQDPIHDATVNIIGSLNILENCRKYGVQKIVYGNSGGAGAGEPQYLPIDEIHPKQPLAHYGVSKQTVEHYLKVYHHLYGLKYTSLGYANVYGPRQDPFGEGGVIAIFSYKLLHKVPPTIFGDGKQTRDFIYVEDVAAANIIALTHGDNDCFLVGTGEEISIINLLEKLKKITKSNIKAQHQTARKGDIIKSCFNIGKIQKILGWNPSVTFDAGLQKTVEYFKSVGEKNE